MELFSRKNLEIDTVYVCAMMMTTKKTFPFFLLNCLIEVSRLIAHFRTIPIARNKRLFSILNSDTAEILPKVSLNLNSVQEHFSGDSIKHLLIKDSITGSESDGWWYWYRRNGMQTSTDDVIVSWIALNKGISDVNNCQALYSKNEVSNEYQYVDLGCGIGSILLLVTYGLLYKQETLIKNGQIEPEKYKLIKSMGIEVQSESASLATRSCKELPPSYNSIISVKQADLREIHRYYCSDSKLIEPTDETLASIHSLRGSCDLLTGNPPYFSPSLGTQSSDSQRRLARFELHGGVEDYCQAARLLLRHNTLSRFVFSFPASEECDRRVCSALQAANLRLSKKTLVLMGRPDQQEPSICIYEASLQSSHDHKKGQVLRDDAGRVVDDNAVEVTTLDIRRLRESNKLNPLYYQIQADLHMAKRPLKRPRRSENTVD